MTNNTRTIQALTNDQLAITVPSIFANRKADGLSDKYQFVPSIQVIEALRGEGWVPVKANQSKSKTEDGKEFVKHQIRLQKLDGLSIVRSVNDLIPEIIYTGSHNGTSATQLDAGIFRLACANGLMVSTSAIDTQRIRHVGFTVNDVIEASYKIIEDIPTVLSSIDKYKSLELSHSELLKFAQSANALRFGKEGSFSENFERILSVRRQDDVKRDLWTVFNVAQENIIRGGIRGRSANGRRVSSREVKSVDEATKLNKKLWALTDIFAEEKTQNGEILNTYDLVNGEFKKAA